MLDLRKLFRHFDHDGQAELCARHLELLRHDLGDVWWNYPKEERSRALRRSNADIEKGHWPREHITLAKHLIRHAGESSDFHATVDFVTVAAIEHISDALKDSKRLKTGSLKQWSYFSHEHMVPGQAVLRLITDKNHPDSPGRLQPFLAALSLRALVTGTKRKRGEGWTPREVDALDGQWSYRLPQPTQIEGWRGPRDLVEILPKYYGLMRYEVAGLLKNLRAVGLRGKLVLSEYFAYRGLPEEVDIFNGTFILQSALTGAAG